MTYESGSVNVFIYPYETYHEGSLSAKRCGSMSWKSAIQYLEDLADNSEETAITEFSAQLTWNRNVLFEYKQHESRLSNMSNRPQLTIAVGRCHKCPHTKCFENIQNGNCTDPFICKHIGERFFTEKYNQKTR